MKNLLLIFTLLFTSVFFSPNVVFSADYQKGLTAYEERDYTTAMNILTPLAENKGVLSIFYSKNNVMLAQRKLGWMYYKGLGVPKDNKTAAKWYTLAAKQGNANAQNSLGRMYKNGTGVPKDNKTSAEWYTLAAEQGDSNAQYNLGWMYFDGGTGVIKDAVYAFMWATIAVANGTDANELRDLAINKMTSISQLEKAQDLTRECVRKKYKGC